MEKRYAPVIVLILLVILITACSGEEEVENIDLPEEIALEGAVLNTGLSLDRGLYITEPQSTFAVDEDFFYSYDNGEPFGDNTVIIEIIDPHANRVIARKERHDIKPDQSVFADSAWIDAPGKFLFSVTVGGEIRATRYVTIE